MPTSHENTCGRGCAEGKATIWVGIFSAQPSCGKKTGNLPAKSAEENIEMDTTYIDRANSNQKVFDTANQKLKEEKGDKAKKIISFIDAYKKQKRKRAARIIRKEQSAIHKISFNGPKLKKWVHPNRRVGRPRLSWTEETVREIWEYIKSIDERYKYKAFDEDSEEVINRIKEYANTEGKTGEVDT